MVDVVSSVSRSRMMSGIRSKNTSPELIIRKALHARGFRFRIHAAHLPGKPDLLLPKYNAAVFVNGCFWHGHSCRYFKLPQTRTEFWSEKIDSNRARDSLHESSLQAKGWRVLVVWECGIRLMNREKSTLLVDMIVKWLLSDVVFFQLDENLLKGIASSS